MLRINRDLKQLVPLRQLRLTPTSAAEPRDLRELILNSPAEFLSEVGYRLFVIGHSIQLSDATAMQLDFLALDENGQAVVVILEREDEKSQLVRGITCAGMVATWKPENFLRYLTEEQTKELGSYLKVETSEINRQQRVIFVAETYDFEALTAANWLKGRGIDVLCIRVSKADSFRTDGEYLWCTQATSEDATSTALILQEGEAGFEVWIGQTPGAPKVTAEQLEAEAAARKQAEQALRASEERYWTLARLSPVGIFHTDGRGNLLYVNERWCEMAGLSQEEAQGQGWARGLHSDDRDRVLTEWHDTTEQGLPFKAEFRFQRPDGGTSWVLGEAAVQKDDSGRVTGYVGTVTELHRVDAARGGMATGPRR